MKEVTLINAKYNQSKTKKQKQSDYIILRDWQNKTYIYMCNSRFNTIVAPTGSGKTVAIEALIWHYLKSNPRHKTIITVPMNNIGYGYGENNFILNKEKISIKIPKRNLLIHSTNNVERLKNFINEPVDDKDISSRIIVCTYATLVRFHKTLSPKEFKIYFNKCQLWIDESHHIQTIKKEEDEYIFNRLSEVANACLDNDFSVNIITATFFRGDGHGFLKPEHKHKFLSYKHTYEDYFNKDCYDLKGVKLHIVLFENNIYDSVYDIYKKRQVPTIIYLPYVQSTICGRDCKATRVKKLIKILKKINNNIKIVDLVTPETQKENSKYIDEQNKIAKKYFRGESEKKPEIDVIIALNVFKEGSDYIPLENVIILGKHNSTVEVMQRAGRAMRDYPSKRESNLYAILPGYSQKVNSNKMVKEVINENFKFFNLTMTLNDIFYPDPKEINGAKVDNQVKKHMSSEVWEKYFEETHRDVKKSVLDEIPYVVSDDKTPEEQWKELEMHCNRILEEKGVIDKKDRKKMFNSLQATFIVSNLLFDPSKKFEKVLMSLIKKISPHDNYMSFASKAFNIHTVSDFKKRLIDSSLYIEDLNIATILAPLLTKAANFKTVKDYEDFRKNIDLSNINQYEVRKKLNKIIKRAKI